MRFRTSTSTFVKVKVFLLREKADREKARWQDFCSALRNQLLAKYYWMVKI